jgi:hypothetical protein
MAEIRLRTIGETMLHFKSKGDSAGQPLELVHKCLTIRLAPLPRDGREWRAADVNRSVDAIFDPGCPHCVFAHSDWQQFEDDIDFLDIAEKPPPVLGLAGLGTNDYQLGRIRLSVIDFVDRRIVQHLPDAWHLAYFNSKNGPDVSLFGLSSPLLLNRKIINRDGEWWLTDLARSFFRKD